MNAVKPIHLIENHPILKKSILFQRKCGLSYSITFPFFNLVPQISGLLELLMELVKTYLGKLLDGAFFFKAQLKRPDAVWKSDLRSTRRKTQQFG